MPVKFGLIWMALVVGMTLGHVLTLIMLEWQTTGPSRGSVTEWVTETISLVQEATWLVITYAGVAGTVAVWFSLL